MMEKKTVVYLGIVLLLCIDDLVTGNDYFPKAQNVTWLSQNFKTLLVWNPKPVNYSYTVEFSGVRKNRERNPHCIRSMDTECDLTRLLTALNDTYHADVLSEPLPGMDSDLVEFPFARSKKFCPYKDTLIGRPGFKINVSEDKTKITLNITDPLSAIYRDNKLLNMRDIFKKDLKYRVTYRKAKSTGRRTATTDTNQIELEVDKGESYCFNVQALIPSRKGAKQLGAMSHIQCSPAGTKSIIEEYGLAMIAFIVALSLVTLVVVIVLIVICCKRCRSSSLEEKAEPFSGA